MRCLKFLRHLHQFHWGETFYITKHFSDTCHMPRVQLSSDTGFSCKTRWSMHLWISTCEAETSPKPLWVIFIGQDSITTQSNTLLSGWPVDYRRCHWGRARSKRHTWPGKGLEFPNTACSPKHKLERSPNSLGMYGLHYLGIIDSILSHIPFSRIQGKETGNFKFHTMNVSFLWVRPSPGA